MSADIPLAIDFSDRYPVLGRVHVCGAGGIGMGAAAHLLLDMGLPVTGSDLRHSVLTDGLEARGMDIAYAPDVERVRRASCVVVSSRFPQAHPEVEAARAAGIPILDRHALIGIVCRAVGVTPILCMGTMARGKLPLVFAQLPHAGWAAGAVACGATMPHAHIGQIMAVDVDERDFLAHPEWFVDFVGCDAIVTDWHDADGYYGEDCSLQALCDAIRDRVLRMGNVMVRPEPGDDGRAAFSVWNRAGRLENVDFAVDAMRRTFGDFAYHGTRVDASAVMAAHVWCRFRKIPQRPDDVSCEGWFRRVAPRQYHEIRMHPVNLRIAIEAIRGMHPDAKIGVAMRPFASTLFAYPAQCWRDALRGVRQILLITPPYEGCTMLDCERFEAALRIEGMRAACVTLDVAHKMVGDGAYWIWSGAGDIVDGS